MTRHRLPPIDRGAPIPQIREPNGNIWTITANGKLVLNGVIVDPSSAPYEDQRALMTKFQRDLLALRDHPVEIEQEERRALLAGEIGINAIRHRRNSLDQAVRNMTNRSWRTIFTPQLTKPEHWLRELENCPWTVARIRAEFERLMMT